MKISSKLLLSTSTALCLLSLPVTAMMAGDQDKPNTSVSHPAPSPSPSAAPSVALDTPPSSTSIAVSTSTASASPAPAAGYSSSSASSSNALGSFSPEGVGASFSSASSSYVVSDHEYRVMDPHDVEQAIQLRWNHTVYVLENNRQRSIPGVLGRLVMAYDALTILPPPSELIGQNLRSSAGGWSLNPVIYNGWKWTLSDPIIITTYDRSEDCSALTPTLIQRKGAVANGVIPTVWFRVGLPGAQPYKYLTPEVSLTTFKIKRKSFKWSGVTGEFVDSTPASSQSQASQANADSANAAAAPESNSALRKPSNSAIGKK